MPIIGLIPYLISMIILAGVIVVSLLFAYSAPGPLCRLLRIPVKTEQWGTLTRIGIALVFAISLFLSHYIWIIQGFNYWGYSGSGDILRMPLEYPYELIMVDSPDYAYIEKWKDRSGGSIEQGIRRYEKRGPLVAGFTDIFEDRWFLFDCNTGQLQEFKTEEEWTIECEKRGFIPPAKMLSMQENWDRYWKDPNRRRK